MSAIKRLSRIVEGDCEIIVGDSRKVLASLPAGSFQCAITSPPYWGLRDYGIEGQIGAEMEMQDYISDLVVVFREVRRVLRDDGTLWLNIGDSYTSGNRGWRQADSKNPARGMSYRPPNPKGLKDKELIGVPWRLAIALQADGWYLRSDIIWYKPNCQPESVKDRPTRSHEHVFLLTKNENYYYDHDAVREPTTVPGQLRARRDVWLINTESSKEAHFAMFPPSLVKVCMEAGSPKGAAVLDPFLGAGTVGVVALKHGRRCTGIELKDDYAEIARNRISVIAAQPTLEMCAEESA
jgi:site-specific DNA-methyltransferase (adenine-specific)/site-specific DNA-methyltransferase (cytosine-N4-specific)